MLRTVFVLKSILSKYNKYCFSDFITLFITFSCGSQSLVRIIMLNSFSEIGGSPFPCCQLLEILCVPLVVSCLLIFGVVSLLWSLCNWTSGHLFQSLWISLNRKGFFVIQGDIAGVDTWACVGACCCTRSSGAWGVMYKSMWQFHVYVGGCCAWWFRHLWSMSTTVWSSVVKPVEVCGGFKGCWHPQWDPYVQRQHAWIGFAASSSVWGRAGSRKPATRIPPGTCSVVGSPFLLILMRKTFLHLLLIYFCWVAYFFNSNYNFRNISCKEGILYFSILLNIFCPGIFKRSANHFLCCWNSLMSRWT